MLVDARTVPDGARIECDIAIVGAGAAGLTIARQFIGSGRNVCLVESGGFELDLDTQALYDGDNIGLTYFPLDSCRLRQFGGTTNHWSGACVPFRRQDFEQRPWLPHSGWPIGLEDVQPYIDRAIAFLELPEAGWDIAHWERTSGEHALDFDQTKLQTLLVLVKPVRIGQVLRQEFEQAPDIHVYLNANAVEIETNATASHVTGVRVRTLAGNGLSVVGGLVVLALGGIENPRLLLLSNRVQSEGLGNAHELVGRYFMEHAKCRGGIVQPASPGVEVGFYRQIRFDRYAISAGWMLPPELSESEQIAPVLLDIKLVYDPAYDSAGAQSLRHLKSAVLDRQLPDDLMADIGNVLGDFGVITGLAFDRVWYGQPPIDRIDVEPLIISTPNPDSRVLLGDQTDALGCRRVELDWRLSELDKRSARRGLEIAATEIGRLGIGRMKITLSGDDTTWPDDLAGVNHHLGTTRMHDDPRQGVVDRDCRVHGIDNLYIAGSSVFPTAGTGTPTMMIIAMALRLADHLRGLAARRIAHRRAVDAGSGQARISRLGFMPRAIAMPERRSSPFPPDFLWGAATSAHQVEGDNRASDWWAFEQAGKLPFQSGAACRHYQLFEQDFELARAWGHNAHRFSIEWSRIEPREGEWDQGAIDHYREVVLALRRRGLEPLVTLHHFTNPAWFTRTGGWARRDSAARFARYVERIAGALKDQVRWWIPINETTIYAKNSFVLGDWPPFHRFDWWGAGQVLRNMGRAHRLAYDILHRARPDALVGLAHSAPLVVARAPARPLDRLAAGLRELVLNRLPVRLMGGIFNQKLDFIGLNYYCRNIVYWQAAGAAALFGRDWPEDDQSGPRAFSDIGWEIWPAGLKQQLARFARYGVPLLITENGLATEDEEQRTAFLGAHLRALAEALAAGVTVAGYFYWSLIDNYEWSLGTSPRFGLAATDYATQRRSPRPAAAYFAEVCRRNALPDDEDDAPGGTLTSGRVASNGA